MKTQAMKRFPPYARQLDELRCAGLIPKKRIIVTPHWHIGKLFPRIIVPTDKPVNSLRFNYLVGLHVQIVCFDRDESILSDLITEILSIKPVTLSVFNMDAMKQGKPAFKLIYSQSEMGAQYD